MASREILNTQLESIGLLHGEGALSHQKCEVTICDGQGTDQLTTQVK